MARNEAREKAMQAAMAAEMRSWLGRANRSQAWMAREIHLSQSAWRHYFTAFDRDLPTGVVSDVAKVMGLTAGELMLKAEAAAPEFLSQFIGDSREEKAALDQAVRRRRSDPIQDLGESQGHAERRVNGR